LGVGTSAELLETLYANDDLRSIRVGWMEEFVPHSHNFSPSFTWKDTGAYSGQPIECNTTPQEPAHILFTSGSTGEPKGVVITHDNVVAFVEWAVSYFGIDSSDRISCHPPLHFDLSTFDIFGAFAVGAQLHLVPSEVSLLPNKLAAFIRTCELTQWFSVPSVLNYMAKFDVVRPGDFPSLRRLLWCGEVFPTPALAYWMQRLPGVAFTNLYGPTETTIASSFYTVPKCPADKAQAIPIGAACAGEKLLVLDHDLRAMPTGAVGELYIGGAGLSPGYWRDPVKTRSTFVAYGEHERIYRTGDLARVGEDGLIYFVGRVDTQIKSRGYRIELGEIETALNGFKELKECAVVAVPTDGFETNVICCAYVPQENAAVTTAEIRQKLIGLLPSYMLPAHWGSFRQLPKNANGKIDRRKIQASFASEISAMHRIKESAPASAPSTRSPKILESRGVTSASDESSLTDRSRSRVK
jgi:amino acid adenylation domain-containing protein